MGPAERAASGWALIEVRLRRAALLVVGAVPFLTAGVYLAMGAGYVLDDWYFRANAHFGGAFAVATGHGGQRPGAVPLYALVFGLLGGNPLPSVLLMALGNSIFVVCLVLLLRRVLPYRLALAVALLWGLLPTHTSLEAWLSCVNIVWSQAAAALGLVVGWRRPRRCWHLAAAGACLLFAVLAYEATVVIALLAAAALPFASAGRLDRPLLATTAGAAVVGLGWVATHWFEAKRAGQLASIDQVFLANTGWGFSAPGTAANLLCVGALIALAVALARLGLPSVRRAAGRGERLMVVGAVLMAAGTAPFALYVYEPLGAGDRMNGLSAVGGALFLVGLACLLASISRTVMVGLALTGLVAASFTRIDRLRTWSVAGRDADAIVELARRKIPQPDGVIVLGPEPIFRTRITAFLEGSSFRSALQEAYDDRGVRADVSRSEAAFSVVPEPLRIDIRAVSRLDEL